MSDDPAARAARALELAKAAPSIEGFDELAALAGDRATWTEYIAGSTYDAGYQETYSVADFAGQALEAWAERDPALFVALLDDPARRGCARGALLRKVHPAAIGLLDARARDRPGTHDDLVDAFLSYGVLDGPIAQRVVETIDADRVPDPARRSRLVQRLADLRQYDQLARVAAADPDGNVRAYACAGLLGASPPRAEAIAHVFGALTPPGPGAWWQLAHGAIRAIRDGHLAALAPLLDPLAERLAGTDGLQLAAGWVLCHAMLRSPADRARLAPRLAAIRAAHDGRAREAIAAAMGGGWRRHPTSLDELALEPGLCTAGLLATPAELAGLCDLGARRNHVAELCVIAARGDAVDAAFPPRWRPLLASLHALAAAASAPGQWYRFDVALALGTRRDVLRFVLELAQAPTFPNLWGRVQDAHLPTLVRDHVPRGSALHARLDAIAAELGAERPADRDVRALRDALAR